MSAADPLMLWKPDPTSDMLGTGYMRFWSRAGVHGLAKVVGLTQLHVLAVSAVVPGTGQFRDFIRQAKAEWHIIYIWEVWDDKLPVTLKRYEFVPCQEIERGETINGWVWRAQDGRVVR